MALSELADIRSHTKATGLSLVWVNPTVLCVHYLKETQCHITSEQAGAQTDNEGMLWLNILLNNNNNNKGRQI